MGVLALLMLAAQPALWVQLAAAPIQAAPSERIVLSWTGHGAERCTLQVIADEPAPLVAGVSPAPVAVPIDIPTQGTRELSLSGTSVATVRCEAGDDVAYADIRLHARRPPPPLRGPRPSRTVPVGVVAMGGVGNTVGVEGLVDPSLDDLGPLGGVGLLIDPDLGSGGILGPLGWTIGTPYTLQLLAAPHGAVTVYGGVGARLGLRFRRLELSTAATTGIGAGVASLPAPGGALELVTEGRALLRWRASEHLLVGAFAGGRAALSAAAGAGGLHGLPALGAFAGLEVLLGLGD
jgi:hypothetical protein